MTDSTPAGRDRPHPPSACTLHQFNQLSRDDATDLVRACWAVERWVTAVVAARPYQRREHLLGVARTAARPLTAAELEAAVADWTRRTGWPPPTLLHDAGTAGRQGAAARQILTEAHAYTERFGRPFLVRQATRSSQEILAKLQIRLHNTPEAENRAVAHELRQIALLALTHTITS